MHEVTNGFLTHDLNRCGDYQQIAVNATRLRQPTKPRANIVPCYAPILTPMASRPSRRDTTVMRSYRSAAMAVTPSIMVDPTAAAGVNYEQRGAASDRKSEWPDWIPPTPMLRVGTVNPKHRACGLPMFLGSKWDSIPGCKKCSLKAPRVVSRDFLHGIKKLLAVGNHEYG